MIIAVSVDGVGTTWYREGVGAIDIAVPVGGTDCY